MKEKNSSSDSLKTKKEIGIPIFLLCLSSLLLILLFIPFIKVNGIVPSTNADEYYKFTLWYSIFKGLTNSGSAIFVAIFYFEIALLVSVIVLIIINLIKENSKVLLSSKIIQVVATFFYFLCLLLTFTCLPTF
mgnify:FL=1|jgi:hypothetical protein